MLGLLILNWNTLEDTLNLLGDLGQQKNIEFKILVIDNGSKDTTEITKIKSQFPNVATLSNPKNVGVAAGFNQGINYLSNQLKCDTFILINSDTRLHDQNFISRLYDRFNAEEKCVLSPIILYEQDNSIWFVQGRYSPILGGPIQSVPEKKSKFKFINLFKSFINSTSKSVKFEDTEWSKLKGLHSAGDFLTGCCLIFDKEFTKTVGEYDESFFSYYEDLDICFRAKKSGYKLLVDFDNILYHKRSASTTKQKKKLTRFHIYLWSRNSIIFAKKHLRGKNLILFIFSRILIQPFWFIKSQDKLYFPYDFYRGMIDGIITRLKICAKGTSAAG